MSSPLKVVQLGNFEPEHSTENHLRRALIENGHTVLPLQENAGGAFMDATLQLADVDFILWTRTGWDWDHVYGVRQGSGEALAFADQRRMLRMAKATGTPVVGYHLDVWRRLNREHQLAEPFFECDLVATADGSDSDHWKALGVNHLWFLPGVSRAECEPGMFRDEFHSKLAFVGSWQGHYHQEHQHRFELVEWLRKNFKRDCAFWPKLGHNAVRGADLRDLYASVDVAIGDSCFSGDGIGAYISDRLPESTGRGAYLLHPHTPLVTDGSLTPVGRSWSSGEHLGCWQAGDWGGLGKMIEWALSNPKERRDVAAAGRAFTLAGHTYETRMSQLVELLTERELLK